MIEYVYNAPEAVMFLVNMLELFKVVAFILVKIAFEPVRVVHEIVVVFKLVL